jgi:LysR family transcriptional regulator, transcriptional activator of nhaA
MIPLNFHQLYYFWTIAKAGSFRAGGEALYLAVPTLSLQIAQLEKSLGVRLFERGRKGVVLTAEGREIYERCERMFTEGDALLAFVRQGAQVPPVLRLGVPDSISAWIVLKIIDFATSVAPGVQVSVAGGSQSELQERLRKRAIDVAVTNYDFTQALGRDFASRLAATIPVSFVGTPALRKKIRRFPRDLASVPLLVRTPENPIRRTLDHYLRERRVIPKIEIEIENTLLIRLLALQGRGAAVIDTLTVNEDLKARRLVKLHAAPTRMQEHVWLLYNARPRNEPQLARVMTGLAKDFGIGLS